MNDSRARVWAAALLLAAGCGGDDGEGGVPTAGPPAASLSDSVFDESRVTEFHLTMPASEWDSLVADDRGDDAYRHADVAWQGVVLKDVAVRPSGHASRFPGNPKPSLKLKFNEFVPKQRFCGLETLKLDGLIERTMLRERLVYPIYRARLPGAPRVANCRLVVNGAYRGLYLFEERVTEDLVEHRYGRSDGHLYQVMVDFPEAYSWRGDDPAAYLGTKPFQQQLPQTGGDHSALPAFLAVLHQRPAELGSVVDLDSLVDYVALEVALVSRDGLLRDDGPPQNHYLYRRPDTGRFGWIPWDVDQVLSDDGVGRSRYPLFYNFEKSRLTTVVRDVPAFQALFRQRLAEFLETLTHPDILIPRIDAIIAQIRPHVVEDPNATSTPEEFDWSNQDLKRLVRDRYAVLKTELAK